MSVLAAGLLALGLLFVVLEVFFPSLGVLAIVASVSIIGGAIVAYNESALIIYLAITFVLLPVVAAFAFKVFPKTPFGKRLTLDGPTFGDDREVSEQGLDALIGLAGVTETPLRPAGIAMIGKRRVDVVSRGELLEAGESVRVVKVEGNRVVVEAEAT